MNDLNPDDELDRWLSRELSARPLPAAPHDLAARARALSERGSDGAIDQLMLRWNWALRIQLLAGLVLAGIAVAIIPMIFSSTATESATLIADEIATETSGLDLSNSLLLAGAIFVGTLLFWCIERAMASDDRACRIGQIGSV